MNYGLNVDRRSLRFTLCALAAIVGCLAVFASSAGAAQIESPLVPDGAIVTQRLTLQDLQQLMRDIHSGKVVGSTETVHTRAERALVIYKIAEAICLGEFRGSHYRKAERACDQRRVQQELDKVFGGQFGVGEL